MAENGDLYTWGGNGYGQLGLGDTTARHDPRRVTNWPGGVVPTITAVAGMADAGTTQHSLAVGDDGVLYAWGGNTVGQLGLGDTTNRSTPQEVTDWPGGVAPTIAAVDAGAGHSLALADDGAVYAWGWNHDGELGLGDRTDRSTPQKVTDWPGGAPPIITAIAAGQTHSLALAEDGTVYAWGWYNMVGLGDIPESPETPQELTICPGGVFRPSARRHTAIPLTSASRRGGRGTGP